MKEQPNTVKAGSWRPAKHRVEESDVVHIFQAFVQYTTLLSEVAVR